MDKLILMDVMIDQVLNYLENTIDLINQMAICPSQSGSNKKKKSSNRVLEGKDGKKMGPKF